MKRYLMLSTLDVSRMTNNREHHLLRLLAPRFDETYVVFRRRCGERGWGAALRHALWPRAHRSQQDGAVFIEVNPLLNHVQGLAMDVAGSYELGDGGRHHGGMRRWVYHAISGFGVLKDISTILFLTWYAWRKAPGKFDVCTVLGPWGGVAGLILKKLGKVRVLAYEDRDYEPGFIPTPLRRRWASALEVACIKRADVCVSTGTRLAKLRLAQTGKTVSLITTGVNLDRFEVPTTRDLHQPTLVYAGNVTFWSGLENVLRALPEIRRAHPRVRLVVAGEGLPGYRAQLEQLVQSLGLADAVEFLGRVDNRLVPGILARAHVGIATFEPCDLRRYAFPLKALEYMAAGLPVIGTRDSETEDLLHKHDCGVAVDFNADAFAQAVIALLDNPQRYAQVSHNARTAVMQYGWSELMEREYSLLNAAYRAQEVPA